MRISESSKEKVTYSFVDNQIKIKHALLAGPFVSPPDNDILNHQLSHLFMDGDCVIDDGGVVLLADGTPLPIAYYDTLDDDGELNILSLGLKSNKERILILFTIYCEEPKSVLLQKIMNYCKIWIDDQLLLQGDNYDGRGEIIFPLAMGEHTVMLEYNSIFNKGLVLYDLPFDEISIHAQMNWLREYAENSLMNKVDIVQTRADRREEAVHEFMVLPKDYIHLSAKDRITVHMYDGNENSINHFTTGMLERVRLDLVEYRKSYPDSPFLKLVVQYDTGSGKREETSYVLVNDWRIKLNGLLQTYQHETKYLNLGLEDKINFEYRYKEVCELLSDNIAYAEDLREIIDEVEILSKLLDVYRTGGRWNDFLFQCRDVVNVYYHSQIDSSVEKYTIALPHSYDQNKAYPVLFHLPIRRYAQPFVYNPIKQMLTSGDEFIFVVPSGRGVTLGSYIGEASFLEVYQLIMCKMNINLTRIYMYGNSNGAYATWAIAQANPHLFTAILVDGGSPYRPNLANVSHMEVIHLCGTADHPHIEHFHQIASLTSYSKEHYTGILLADLNHFDAEFYTLCPSVLKLLLSKSMDCSTMRIQFRTERQRHNQTRYITLNEISKECEYAELTLDKNDIQFSVELTHVNRFTIAFDDEWFKYIHINEKPFDVGDYGFTSSLTFQLVNDTFELINTDKLENRYSCQGMGLLDIYLEDFQTFVPLLEDHTQGVIEKTANAFLKPVTNTWRPEIHVNYQKYYYKDLKLESLRLHTLLFCDHRNEELTIRLRALCGLYFDPYGYQLSSGEYIEGSYILVVMTRQMLDPSKKLMFLYTNDYELLDNSFLSGSLMLNGYVNGRNKYLNKQVLLYSENGVKSFDIDNEERSNERPSYV
ncbi:hypothetical protein [Paenibacillus sinopodophylli]|uniref:hypothetical protein n=1 Tax=Paenibacillus sinopodophylli TaxID=1837342 RepID=UPI00110CCFFE|nr:hypothetical protein [Paenibacillus sinopodophylli]